MSSVMIGFGLALCVGVAEHFRRGRDKKQKRAAKRRRLRNPRARNWCPTVFLDDVLALQELADEERKPVWIVNSPNDPPPPVIHDEIGGAV